MKLDNKEVRNNRVMTRLDDYELDKLNDICLVENKKPATILRIALNTYIQEQLRKQLGE